MGSPFGEPESQQLHLLWFTSRSALQQPIKETRYPLTAPHLPICHLTEHKWWPELSHNRQQILSGVTCCQPPPIHCSKLDTWCGLASNLGLHDSADMQKTIRWGHSVELPQGPLSVRSCQDYLEREMYVPWYRPSNCRPRVPNCCNSDLHRIIFNWFALAEQCRCGLGRKALLRQIEKRFGGVEGRPRLPN